MAIRSEKARRWIIANELGKWSINKVTRVAKFYCPLRNVNKLYQWLLRG